MKTLQIIILTLCLKACTTGQADKSEQVNTDTISIRNTNRDTVSGSKYKKDWQSGFGLTHDPNKDTIWYKPVNYYLSDKECSELAKDFYFGRLKPSDNHLTEELLALVTTDNDKLRPFYRWCLNKTITIQDGALAEYTGIPARQYAEKFPKDFFEYMDRDTSKDRYNNWVSSIEYSGFYDIDHHKTLKAISKRMIKTMKANCQNCDDELKKRIEIFAKECFENSINRKLLKRQH